MINEINGFITLEDNNSIISPRLKKEDFLNSKLYKYVINKQKSIYSSFYLQPQKFGDKNFIMILYFNQTNIIEFIQMSLVNQNKIPSWNDWEEKSAIEKKNKHDKWLELKLGKPPYKYKWGEISSNYDPRSGSSTITIRYYC